MNDARIGLVANSREVTSDISQPGDDQTLTLALAVLAHLPTAALAGNVHASARRLQDVRAGRARPRTALRKHLIELARSLTSSASGEPQGQAPPTVLARAEDEFATHLSRWEIAPAAPCQSPADTA